MTCRMLKEYNLVGKHCRPSDSEVRSFKVAKEADCSFADSSMEEEGNMIREKKVVCVTGAGGFLGSWVVKTLLSRGYTVRGTVRDPDDRKNEHLRISHNNGTSAQIQLVKADVLNYDEMFSAISGCEGVFHVASPVPSAPVSEPEKELMNPAVNGTLNVLQASSEAGVRRVSLVASVASVMMTPSHPNNNVYDESCRSDSEYCRMVENFYSLSKTAAEKQSWEYAKDNGLDLVTFCPGLILGPMLQPTVNTSSGILIRRLKGEQETVVYPNVYRFIVDVRDAAEALVLALEKPQASGRYICNAHNVRGPELDRILKLLYPGYKCIINQHTEEEEEEEEMHLSSNKLQGLGWSFRPLEETISDSIRSYVERDLLG